MTNMMCHHFTPECGVFCTVTLLLLMSLYSGPSGSGTGGLYVFTSAPGIGIV